MTKWWRGMSRYERRAFYWGITLFLALWGLGLFLLWTTGDEGGCSALFDQC